MVNRGMTTTLIMKLFVMFMIIFVLMIAQQIISSQVEAKKRIDTYDVGAKIVVSINNALAAPTDSEQTVSVNLDPGSGNQVRIELSHGEVHVYNPAVPSAPDIRMPTVKVYSYAQCPAFGTVYCGESGGRVLIKKEGECLWIEGLSGCGA